MGGGGFIATDDDTATGAVIAAALIADLIIAGWRKTLGFLLVVSSSPFAASPTIRVISHLRESAQQSTKAR